jgi:hypothetical protein
MKGQLTRDILSADFDALFAWAKERETYQQSHHNSIPGLVLSKTHVEESTRHYHHVHHNSIAGLVSPVTKRAQEVANDKHNPMRSHSDENQDKLYLNTGNDGHLHRPHSVIGTLSPQNTIDSDDSEMDKRTNSSGTSTKSTPSKHVTIAKRSPQATRSYKITAKGLVVRDVKKTKSPALYFNSKKANGEGAGKKKNTERRDMRVALIGEYGVGKRELIREFLTPDDPLRSSIDDGK